MFTNTHKNKETSCTFDVNKNLIVDEEGRVITAPPDATTPVLFYAINSATLGTITSGKSETTSDGDSVSTTISANRGATSTSFRGTKQISVSTIPDAYNRLLAHKEYCIKLIAKYKEATNELDIASIINNGAEIRTKYTVDLRDANIYDGIGFADADASLAINKTSTSMNVYRTSPFRVISFPNCKSGAKIRMKIKVTASVSGSNDRSAFQNVITELPISYCDISGGWSNDLPDNISSTHASETSIIFDGGLDLSAQESSSSSFGYIDIVVPESRSIVISAMRTADAISDIIVKSLESDADNFSPATYNDTVLVSYDTKISFSTNDIFNNALPIPQDGAPPPPYPFA